MKTKTSYAKNKENIFKWKANNKDRVREIARKSIAKKRAYQKAARELMDIEL